MKDQIIIILKDILGADAVVELTVPDEPSFGHFSTNAAMRFAKARGAKPMELAKELAAKAKAAAPAGFFEKVEAAVPGFVNFWLTKEAIQKEFAATAVDGEYGRNKSLAGKTVMVEYTDPNPFKQFHIGHLMTNTIGESLARLHEASAAAVVRANYQGDVGLHVAKAIWGMEHAANGDGKLPAGSSDALTNMAFLGKAYAAGAQAYDNDPAAKEAIVAINEKVYSRSDVVVNGLYDTGRAWSLEYFETIYERLGTKFDHYFFESEMAKEGMAVVLSHHDIFEKSDGAIVFPGEQYGLHTRVFVNSKGLPTYEAKELGLNKRKFELYPLDASLIVTANEVADYFRVLLKTMELIMPEVAKRTRHVPHGMLRLPSGKMSSRTGDVITADALLDQVKAALRERVSEKSDLPDDEREAVTEAIAVGAVKYSILKQNPGQDITFDFEKSLSFEGDAGPYVQYAYARLQSILRKAAPDDRAAAERNPDAAAMARLDSDNELSLMRKIFEFPDAALRAREFLAPSGLVAYVYKLAARANKFYETTPILKDEDLERRRARLALAVVAARTLRSGLELLGIKALERI